MNARRFTGGTTREVLAMVRQALGEDALILTNRTLNDGIEIIALPGDGLRFDEAESPASASPHDHGSALQPGVAEGILNEIQCMRVLLQRELATLTCIDLHRRNPARTALMRELLAAGFSPQLARRFAEGTQEGRDDEPDARQIAARLEESLVLAQSDEMVVRGGVYALVGPTGVGKTTTVAKLAARGVVRHGASRVALLTTDGYRIAGHDQLRVYGRILGVPVHAIKDGTDLSTLLAELRGRHLVLIDTMGMSQRDKTVAEQAALLSGNGGAVRRLLLLNATCNMATLDEVAAAYRHSGLDGCIITKIDEAAGLATAVDAVIRHQLPVYYVTNGQRVPEDLHLPNRVYLAHRALKPSAAAQAHALTPEEFPLAMAAAQAGVTTGASLV